MYKMSAQYVKACRGKVRNTVYFQYCKFQKGITQQKLTKIANTRKRSEVRKMKVIYKISAQYVNASKGAIHSSF